MTIAFQQQSRLHTSHRQMAGQYGVAAIAHPVPMPGSAMAVDDASAECGHMTRLPPNHRARPDESQARESLYYLSVCQRWVRFRALAWLNLSVL